MDLIFVSMENWDEIWRRNQFVCSELATKYPERKILFVGLARDISNHIRRGKFRSIGENATRTIPEHPQITFTRPLKFFPNTLSFGRRLNDAIARRHIRKKAAELQLKSPMLWLNPHSAVHMVGKMGECASVYDITDDWISLTQSAAVRTLTIEQDAQMCGKVDAVIVCSQRLYDLKQKLAQNLHLIPNGVDCEHYRCVLEGTGQLPKEARGWERPVLGYTGTIHPDRVDVALLEHMANQMREGSIALVGPCHLPDPVRIKLEATGRISFTGSVPYTRVPEIMRAFDVCITPHLVTEFTESLNPIKLWEYLASGKPIVSTPVAGFRDFPKYVRIASTSDEFLNAARTALSEEPEIPELRKQEARNHSWQQRVDAIIEVFEQAKSARDGAGRA